MNETLKVLESRRSCRNGHCALGYAAEAPKAPADRKADYVFFIE